MRVNMIVCAVVLSGCSLLDSARAHAEGAIQAYARGDYSTVVNQLEPDYRLGQAGIQERLLLARAYLHLGRPDDSLAALRSFWKATRRIPRQTA